MFVSDSLGVNEKGHLTVSGADTTELAGRYGTPLMVYSEDGIRRNCRKFVSSIEENYDGNGLALYASKAFSCLEMYRICKQENMGVDVVSGGELYTALKAGFPAERIYFHGNNKTDDEIAYALQSGVGRIVADNVEELRRISKMAAQRGQVANLFLRIKPGIDAHTHNFIRTGQIDSKFGFALETGEAMEAVRLVLADANLSLKGLHCHIGSQIFDIDPFEHAAEVMLTFIADIKKETGVELGELNLGGGFGIKYTEKDAPEDFTAYMKRVSVVVKEKCAALGVRAAGHTTYELSAAGAEAYSAVVLTDHLTGRSVDLKAGAYTFSLPADTCVDNRFSLRFSLSDEGGLTTGGVSIEQLADGRIRVSGLERTDRVRAFNVAGQLEMERAATAAQMEFRLERGIHVVEVGRAGRSRAAVKLRVR